MSLSTIGTNPAAIWSYPSRTLTMTKFPFWSAIILPQESSVSLPAGTSNTIDIQPSSGETWWIFVNTYANNAAIVIELHDYDGTTARLHTAHSGTGINPHIESSFIISSSRWLRIIIRNTTTSSYTGYYGYSGFKLSQPQWTPKRLNSAPLFKRATRFSIPDAVKAIADRIVDTYDFSINDYRQTIILEEDTPLTIDEKTGFPVERYSAYIYVDEFISNILTQYINGQLNLVKSGWKKYEAILGLLVRR